MKEMTLFSVVESKKTVTTRELADVLGVDVTTVSTGLGNFLLRE